MRVAAILGLLIFSGFAVLVFNWTKKSFEDKKNGDIQTYPPICGVIVFISLIIVIVICLIYAIGLWDAFVEWTGVGNPDFVILHSN